VDAALTALVGFLGVIAGGLLQMRRGRIEQLRERQLVAADEFASAGTTVFLTLSLKMEALGQPDLANPKPWLDGFAAAVEETRDALHELTARLPRLELLFGVGSGTPSKGAELISHLHRMTLELKKPARNATPVVKEFEAAADAFGDFNRRANQAMTLPGWRQWPVERRATRSP
jgi:hypothetical protein